MEHPIQGLMDTAMKNIRAMVDVDTIIGQPVNVPDGTIIIPVSTVSFGFGAGGSDFGGKENSENHFGGGSGGGARVKPVAFLVVGNGNVKILPISNNMSSADRIIDMMPEMIDKVNGAVKDFSAKMEQKKQEKQEKKNNDKKKTDDVPEVDPF